MLANALLNEALTLTQLTVLPMNADLMSPFPIASDTDSKNGTTHNALVVLEDDDGVFGYGEAAPFKGISGDTQELVIAELSGLASHLLCAPMTCVELEERLMQRLRFASSRAAVEMAFLDLLAKKRREPLHKLLNPRSQSRSHQTDITIPLLDPLLAAQFAAKYVEAGFKRIKIKVGDGFESSFWRVLAVSSFFRASAGERPLLIDANEGFSPIDAILLMRRLDEKGIYPGIFEQPVPRNDLRGLKQVAQEAHQRGTKIFADESVYNAFDAKRVAEANACDGINLKLMKHGGFLEALRIAEVAHQSGLSLMVGGMVETRLAMTATFHLALAVGHVCWFDLDTPLLLEERILQGGLDYMGPRMNLPEGLGIGVGLS